MSDNQQMSELRDRTIELLVDEQITRRMAGGEVFAKPESMRALIRNDICQQAREYPGWLRQQAKRLGVIKGKAAQPAADRVCELCHRGIYGEPHAYRGGKPYCSERCASAVVISFAEWLEGAPAEHRQMWSRLKGAQPVGTSADDF